MTSCPMNREARSNVVVTMVLVYTIKWSELYCILDATYIFLEGEAQTCYLVVISHLLFLLFGIYKYPVVVRHNQR
jgi:hypothetical protein